MFTTTRRREEMTQSSGGGRGGRVRRGSSETRRRRRGQDQRHFIYALITILGSTFYCIGGLLTLRLKNKKNENVTTSTTLWSVIFLLPFSLIFETPWNSNPTFVSTLSLLYLGVVATGLAWLIRFRILTVNGLVFQTQVAYLIPIFGIIFGFFVMNEIITWRVFVSLVIILLGIYIFKKNNKGTIT